MHEMHAIFIADMKVETTFSYILVCMTGLKIEYRQILLMHARTSISTLLLKHSYNVDDALLYRLNILLSESY